MNTVSVIVPLRNEAGFVERTLPTILAQDDRRIVEMVFLDGRSEDGTPDRIRTVLAAQGFERASASAAAAGQTTGETWQGPAFAVHLLDNPALHVPHALNLGIRASRGSLLVRMDAHSAYPPDYVRLCVDGLLATGAENYGGVAVATPASDRPAAAAVAAVTSHRLGVGGSRFRISTGAPGPADTVPFGCFRRELFGRIGGFDERLVRNQDNEFNARIRAQGGTVVLDPAIRFTYYNQATIRGLLRQGWKTGRWNAFTLAWAPHAFRWRHVLPGVFVLGSAACTACAIGGLATGRRFLLTLGVSGLLVHPLAWLAALPGLARRWGLKAAALAPATAWLYHNAYGFGILSGLLSLPRALRTGNGRTRTGNLTETKRH